MGRHRFRMGLGSLMQRPFNTGLLSGGGHIEVYRITLHDRNLISCKRCVTTLSISPTSRKNAAMSPSASDHGIMSSQSSPGSCCPSAQTSHHQVRKYKSPHDGPVHRGMPFVWGEAHQQIHFKAASVDPKMLRFADSSHMPQLVFTWVLHSPVKQTDPTRK